MSLELTGAFEGDGAWYLTSNERDAVCRGGKLLIDCATTKELMQRSFSVSDPVDSSMPEGCTSNGNTHLDCMECGMECGVSVKFKDNRLTEERCFVFTDPTHPKVIEARTSPSYGDEEN